MKYLLFIMFLSLAYSVVLIASDEPLVQIDSAKPADEKVIHKYKIGFSYGLAFPNRILSHPEILDFKKTAFFDMRIGKSKTIFYSTLNYSSFGVSIESIWDHVTIINGGHDTKFYTKSSKPYKSYTLVTGLGYTTSATGRYPALRLGLGPYWDYSHEDAITITYLNSSDTLVTVPLESANKFSAGINFRIGLDVPLYLDIIGLSSDIDLSVGLVNVPFIIQGGGSSWTIGIFGRF